MKKKYTVQMVDAIEKRKRTAFVARHTSKIFSKYFTPFFANRGLSPNDVTTISFLVGIIASFFFLLGSYHWLVIAALIVELSLVFDSCDGELARLLKRQSPKGSWWDGTLDDIKKVALFGSIGIGQFMRFNNPLYLLLSFFAISNIYLIEEQNTRLQLCMPDKKASKKAAGKKPEFLLKGDYIGLIDTVTLAIFLFAIADQLLLLLLLLAIAPIPIWVKQIAKGIKRMKE